MREYSTKLRKKFGTWTLSAGQCIRTCEGFTRHRGFGRACDLEAARPFKQSDRGGGGVAIPIIVVSIFFSIIPIYLLYIPYITPI